MPIIPEADIMIVSSLVSLFRTQSSSFAWNFRSPRLEQIFCGHLISTLPVSLPLTQIHTFLQTEEDKYQLEIASEVPGAQRSIGGALLKVIKQRRKESLWK